jgi:pimeloyl-ACP methyl ester carboxylesterase
VYVCKTNYPQYLSDMTTLIERTGGEKIDWVGTSMGGIIGMLLAAEGNTPIRRLVINDIGPFIPLVALKRIGAYVSQNPAFDSIDEVEKYMREIYASFGNLSDENWRHLVRYGTRPALDGKLSLAYDPAIAEAFQHSSRNAKCGNASAKIAHLRSVHPRFSQGTFRRRIRQTRPLMSKWGIFYCSRRNAILRLDIPR